MAFARAIHLLYVPTTWCNMDCTYCYMGEQTEQGFPGVDACANLQRALDLFLAAGVLPFNVSLHGGEVTSLPSDQLDGLFSIIAAHYLRHHDAIAARGQRKQSPHIKTNLLNFDRHIDLFRRHRVSVSASVDLPLSLHERYRRLRHDRSSRERISENIRLLGAYPGRTNLSSTLFKPHVERLDELVDDIWHVHRDCGYDMNRYNIMIGFASGLNADKMARLGKDVLEPMDGDDQLRLYSHLQRAFADTDLAFGFKEHWFTEFTPSYCPHGSSNCGERFFLLQADGEVYSCVRGQGNPDFHYGNLFSDGVEAVLNQGRQRIATAHQRAGFAAACSSCDHLHHCHTGCPFVKQQEQAAQSYTCDLQRRLYSDNPAQYPPMDAQAQERYSQEYRLAAHPASSPALAAAGQPATGFVTSSDIDDPAHRLGALIAADPTLQLLYAEDAVFLEVADDCLPLRSSILHASRDIVPLAADSEACLHLRRSLFDQPGGDPQQCTLHLQLLRDTPVRYGDEQRLKQEHLVTHEVFLSQLDASRRLGPDFVCFPLTPLLQACAGMFRPDVANLLFVTTNTLRRYHYEKQRRNGFYHIQALNLPFQHVVFYWG